MFGGAWNRHTKFSLGCLALAVIAFALALFNPPFKVLALYLIILAVALAAGSIFVEGIGIRRSRLFSYEAAQGIHHRVTQLIEELRILAPALHKQYRGLPNRLRRYESDGRYRQLENELNRVLDKCYDYTLYKKLSQLISDEKLSAKYLPLPEFNIPNSLQSQAAISNYIGEKLRSRKVSERK